MKRLLDLFAIFLLLILATSVFFLFSFHPDRYKSDFLGWFNQQSDWQLTYQSSNWSLTDPLSIEIYGLELAKSEQAALMAKSVQLELAALPLLKGQLSLKLVTLENAQLAMRPELLQASKPADGHSTQQDFSLLWINQLQIKQLQLKDSDVLWQQGQQSYHLKQLELSIEDFAVDLAHPSPSDWQFSLQASAEKLDNPYQEVQLPQLNLQYSNQKLSITHLGADLWQGSFYGSGELSNKHLQVQQLVLNNARIEHFTQPKDKSPLANQASTQGQQFPSFSWLEQIDIDSILLNKISMATQVSGHNLVLNHFTGELENIHSRWPLKQEQVTANYAFIADEVTFDQFQLSELTASGAVAQGRFTLDAFRSDVFKGKLSLALDYHWQQAALNIQQLTLSNSEIPIQPSWLSLMQTKDNATEQVSQALTTSPRLQQLNIEQVNLQQVKLLSYLDQFPFSAEGLNVELRHLALLKDGQWQNIEQLWQPSAQLFIEAPELAFRGIALSHVSMDVGAEQQLGYFNLYGELPLGQFELQGQALLDQQHKPWKAEISGLLLNLSSLARLANNRDFKLLGDLTFSGKLHGKLQDFNHNIDGSIDLHSQLLQLPGVDLEVTLDQIIESPRQYFEDPNPLIANGLAVFWQAPNSLPKGLTQFTNLALSATIGQGKLSFAPQRLPGLRYQLTLQGDIDLAAQRFDNLQFVVADQPCWRLVHTIDGHWSAPTMSFDHYRSQRRYLVEQHQFVQTPQVQPCRYPLNQVQP
ncbi:hypothetical protein [Agarivorans sp. QJM3NY_33]|uniref:hypothetical protein n=1 Tax=Agarivorans sp. QJM3NY_33 TaxID=3421432 RepID=UPI003D7DB713